VINAAQAIGNEGKISVRMCSLDDMAKIIVNNTNSYIDPDDQGRIFQPFFTKDKEGGTGLGLAICKRIVTDHGGRIRVESDMSSGTTFVVSLPIVKPIALVTANKKENSQGEIFEVLNDIKNCRLLIADDDEIYQELIIGIVQGNNKLSSNVETLAVASGEEALERCIAFNPHAIIVDLDFGPGNINGLATVLKLRSAGVLATICVHSNDNTSITEEAAFRAGADLFFPKPISDSDLRRVLSLRRKAP
jgi:CheY-like chemotaxis protein